MAYSPLITHHIISNSTSETKNPTIQTCLYHCNIQKTFLKNNTTSPILGFCPMVCLPICPSLCHYTYSNDPLLIPSPPNFPSSKPNKPHNIISPLLITIITLFSLSFLFIIFYILYTKLYQTSHRISQRSESETDRNYSLDEEHGNTVVFHPFWNISTFGLALSAIQRIPIKKYVKENNMEERDCTVCLGEFKEGESLRVLPKCCHVFHVSCIDTWLASHITCPICRSHVLPLDHHDDHDHDHDHDHDCGV